MFGPEKAKSPVDPGDDVDPGTDTILTDPVGP
jgi:hypothetical protein